jgi:ketosteroid isomerase-like protein
MQPKRPINLSIEKELIQFGKNWDQAIANNQVEEIAKFMSDDWVIIGTEGGITPKSFFLESIASGDLVHTKMDFEDMRIKVYPNCGVVTSRGTSSGTYKGSPFSFFEWTTSTYIREGGNWRCALTMLTPANTSE